MRANQKNIINYLKELKPELLKDGIVQIALFGSFAKNQQNVYSDIDIAISKDKDFLLHNSPYQYFDIINKIKSKIKKQFHRNIDVFDLDSNSDLKCSIQKEILYV